MTMNIHRAEFICSSATPAQCPDTQLPEFAFIGRSNVGKSSLINMLTQRKSLAKTSSTPGKTKLINHFLMDESWYLVDLPGYGYAKASKTDRKAYKKLIYGYFESRQNLVNAFVLIDCRHAPLPIDLEFLTWLGMNQIPLSIVFTKTDKLSSAQLNKNLLKYKQTLLQTWESLPPIFTSSASAGLGRQEILDYIGWCIDVYSQSRHTQG
ncbi:MAG: ribosome biogenesis GTP-binding protein YihA/YsxC [Salibacteraceae bacterium]